MRLVHAANLMVCHRQLHAILAQMQFGDVLASVGMSS